MGCPTARVSAGLHELRRDHRLPGQAACTASIGDRHRSLPPARSGVRHRSAGSDRVFGVVVTLGLFMYELRGIQRCHRLEDQAGVLEYELGLDLRTGPFRGQPRRSLCGMLGPPGAGLVVYLAVMFAWLYVAGVGYGWWPEPEVGLGLAWLLVPGYLVVLAVAWVAVRSWCQVGGGRDGPSLRNKSRSAGSQPPRKSLTTVDLP